ncbi:FGGY-family carbohydrate kinase [Pedobacter caeni]|uniref:Sugar (Pentulose or hexulose) kinase n=1 Tax=Pedobacter caeni TaxID=288992 RepID=A0A1M4U9J1_9SPHI|nr:FGGY family carbohydrate kinase [Pedobacter caeni]SHE53395.1 Sugar (pentulose or hexulose) kinase [Pedobacter caeni]
MGQQNKPVPVIAIFDVGKTNKKLFLFDEQYHIVFERTARFTETVDEDGDPCENLESLRLSIFDSLREVFKNPKFEVKSINFTTYGASLVYIDKDGQPLAPLYNYLKPYPEELKHQFYAKYGGEESFANTTASPVLGSLNSGLQLYRIKQEKPELFEQIKYALHLPQYLSYLISGAVYSDLTSIGCHTALWDFEKQDYHKWVKAEGILDKLAPVAPSDHVMPAAFPGNNYAVGIGFHDSSAALIPYLINFQEPFILLSTGTWCISMNPFNSDPLTVDELKNDCLCYLQFEGKPVKASRVFAGYEHEQQIKRIAAHFGGDVISYRNAVFDPGIIELLRKNPEPDDEPKVEPSSGTINESLFSKRKLSDYATDLIAYHQLMLDLIAQQYHATQMVLKGTTVKRIFVDGGFSKNAIFMNLLSAAFPELEVFAASMAQATAVGAALAIHKSWNSKALPNDIIQLKFYSAAQHHY